MATTTTPARALPSSAARTHLDRQHLRGAEPVRRCARRGDPPCRAGRDRGGDRGRRARVPGDAQAAGLEARRGARRGSPTGSRRAARTSRARSRSRPASRSRPRASRPSARRSPSASPPRRRSASTASSCQLDWLPGHRGPHRARAPRPARPDRRHLAVQLPAEPRRAQGRAGARGRATRSSCGPRARRRSARSSSPQIVLEAGWPEEGIAVVPSTTGRRGAARRGRPHQAAARSPAARRSAGR